MKVVNPKMEGSNLIPLDHLTGPCPVGCLGCYCAAESFYRDKGEILIPTKEESEGKIVRCNDGHDSGIKTKELIEICEKTGYKDFYFNTALSKSLGKFKKYPVVFTCNGGKGEFNTNNRVNLVSKNEGIKNLMFVRVRTNTWNLETVVDKAVHYYTSYGVPVMLTFMRYSQKLESSVKRTQDYEFKGSNLSSSMYYYIKKAKRQEIVDRYKNNPLVFTCGTPKSSKCKDCGNCGRLYKRFKERK